MKKGITYYKSLNIKYDINLDKNLKSLNQNIEKNNLNDLLKDDIILKNEKVITKEVENLESNSNTIINKNYILPDNKIEIIVDDSIIFNNKKFFSK